MDNRGTQVILSTRHRTKTNKTKTIDTEYQNVEQHWPHPIKSAIYAGAFNKRFRCMVFNATFNNI